MNATKSARLLPALVILVAMIAAPMLTEVMRPNIRFSDTVPKVDLEVLIPKEFGEWRTLPATGMIVDPQTQQKLDRIYTQTLSRTYSNSRGQNIMLSIAYGEDQRDTTSVLHYPEVCYPSQGFENRSSSKAQLRTSFGVINVKRLEMVQGDRFEPVTYWTMMGEHQSLDGIDKKLIEARYTLNGIILDGLLFRVSSISRDSATAYVDHDSFVVSLLSSVSPEARKRLAGL